MGEGIINNCRGCRSKKLKQALKIQDKQFVICQTCTLLQRQDNVAYNISFDLTQGIIEVDYYPYFLTIKAFPKDTIVFFSLKAIEAILEQEGYVVIDATTTNDGKLLVKFDRMNNLDRIRLYEMVKKLSSQFTYFLHSVKNK